MGRGVRIVLVLVLFLLALSTVSALETKSTLDIETNDAISRIVDLNNDGFPDILSFSD